MFKTKRRFQSLTYALNIFVSILLFINIVQLSAYVLNQKKTDNAVYPHNRTGAQFIHGSSLNNTFPDIYYIILDGYANDSILSSFYNFKQNPFTGFLKINKFLVASSSRTNYIATFESLTSSLNFSYLDSINAEVSIVNNKVCRYLKDIGYKIVHVRSGYAVTRENDLADVILPLQNLNEFERTLMRCTIFRLDDLFGYVHYSTLKEQLKVINKVFEIQPPKFVFIHIVSPHPPYVCDENGNFKRSTRMINDWWEPKEDYIRQVKFINHSMRDFISHILASAKTQPIIIVQSDHGPWLKTNSVSNVYNARSLILNAYHIPYPWKNKLYNSITPVNSFPIIFNNLFHDSIAMLKDIPMDSAGISKYVQTQAD